MRRTRAIPAVAIGVITVIAAAHPAACALAPRPLYSISPIAAPPHIDGRVDDACWQTAARIGPFVLMGSAADPTQETHAWAAYDEGALYLAFECIEARMQDLRAARSARDSDVWHDDCVEVFLDPQRDRRHYFHLAVNANAAMYDERAALRPDEWDGEWHAAATRDSDRWTVEIAVPFATLGADPPGVLEAWGFNLAREERPHRELSQISPTVGSFHDPERFADLVFRGPGLLTASVVSAGAPSLGRHQAEVRLCNGGARPARVALWAETPGERQQRLAVDVASQTTRVVSVPYEVSAEGDLTLSLNAADAAGCSLLRSTPVSFHVEPNRQRLREIARMLHTLTQPARERGLAPELAKVQRDGERLLAYATDRQRWASGARSQWERLTALADRLDFRANRLRLSALTADPQAGYAIGVESPLRKLRPDRPYRGPVGRPAELRLCRNEYEPVQVVVLALDKPLHRVRTYATDLVGPGGARIRDHNVNLNLVGFVHTRKPAYQVERIGWYPDPLMDIEPFDVEADRFQPVWVTVYCPAAVPAGEYRGEIIIRPDNAPETRVPLVA
ncbi:MAG: carbohydrate-binding family 9-like protein, partial [Armatimonadota bacterium]